MSYTPNIEDHIDSFLEQFRRSASRAMEERQLDAFYVEAEAPDTESYEHIEMHNQLQMEPMNAEEIVDLLQPQYAIITGGKSNDGCPLITFPDNNNFNALSDSEYQQLMLCLTSGPLLQDADLGFHLIIDRRKDRWNSVKTVLLKISMYFPGLIQVVYVLRPASFLQKALSEVSNKLFKDEFKFRMIVLSTVDELHEYIDINQLTSDLGGSLPYVHQEWIKQRIALEKFSLLTHEISNSLDTFTKTVNDTEFPNNVDSTQQLLNQQMLNYSELKEEILSAAKQGESLLNDIKENSSMKGDSTHRPDIGNIFAIERLLVQLEETERTFDVFWQQHSSKLRHCLELRRFEQDFRELQINFDSHIKTLVDMTEIGDSVTRIDTLMRETQTFQKLCMVDIDRAEEVISSGQQLVKTRNSCPPECIEPKCSELMRMRDILSEKLVKRISNLVKSKQVMEQIQKVTDWCTNGIELLLSQKIEDCDVSSRDLLNKYLQQTELFLSEFDSNKSWQDLQRSSEYAVTPEIAELIKQTVQQSDAIYAKCEEHIATLKQIIDASKKRFHANSLPQQPTVGAPIPAKACLRKSSSKMEGANGQDLDASPENDNYEEEIHRVKRGHVLGELLETERVYVTELRSIIEGYKLKAQCEEMLPLVPAGLIEKLDIIFGNIEEIYDFHAKIFLKDLENCISSTDLVALCFVQRRDTFYRLYSYYCQNTPRSEQLRETLNDSNAFFQACQIKLGHKLPLAAYLLKPVQRITKYQLLLKDLLKYCTDSKCAKQLQQALECMLVVLKCVNDSMHQISIKGFPLDLSQQGDLLLQGSFSVWAENKKDIRLRLKPMQRHIFLYQKAMLFCKPASKTAHNKATYQFKHFLKMSQIGLTESVKGDVKKFEVWLQGRQEVYTVQASNIEQKQAWVNEIKRVLLNQLEELKGEKIRQYSAVTHRPLRQTVSWEKKEHVPNITLINHASCDSEIHSSAASEDDNDIETGNWSSDCSNSEDEEQTVTQVVPSGRYVALADYCAMGNSEVNMREGDMVELLKVGCAGWWFVKIIGSSVEGWAPAAYLENLHRKTSRSSSRSQDRLN